ncbi:ABC transporter ATP-binding protein [Rufibacter tibetensis]|uniref:Antibiotic ABC transporter ATP-binding protein n=1 Tax=Rufibacter tibetensis TaxID=512763 RepID=A0A0P0CPS1_9BACT|nr:ABC transporter ATP-binding protein [Rufibacter tibetensis]ALI99307.1 antibiotic ABC transporter ATP-binding protein [Rufibacter tibetensis]
MKTYFRILKFARPFSQYVPWYAMATLLATIFGVLNFGLLAPLLKVLFGQAKSMDDIPAVVPAFEFNIAWFTQFFYYHVGQIIQAEGSIGALRFICILLVISVLLANVFRYIGLRIEGVVRARVVKNLRMQVFERLTQLQLGFFSNQRKGNIMSTLTNDVQEVENSVVSTLNVLFREPFLLIGYFVVLFYISPQLTFFSLLVLPVSGLIISTISKKLKRQSSQGQDALGSILGIIDETLSGLRVIKGFNAQPYVLGKFRQSNSLYARIITSMNNKRSLASPFSEFMGVTAVAGILFYGGSLVLRGESDLGGEDLIAYLALFSQVLVPVKAISNAFSNIQRGLVSGERVLKLIDTEPLIRDRPDSKTLPEFTQAIEFKNVSFRYDNDPILQDINLRIPKGKTIALVGPSGGGKSTLADLLPRFYDPTQGAITIDGLDLRDCSLHSVREQMGIVTQESILFNDTIFNNIAFNKTDATEAEVIAAAKIANAHEFIVQSPDGYQTVIGDRGSKLSGGQRQRLSIARAILKNPPILIMDEATSALDTESEKLVQEALTNLMKNRTSIVIAHRLSTIQHADEIIVLQGGRIVERGNHSGLVQQGGLYFKLTQMQHTT